MPWYIMIIQYLSYQFLSSLVCLPVAGSWPPEAPLAEHVLNTFDDVCCDSCWKAHLGRSVALLNISFDAISWRQCWRTVRLKKPAPQTQGISGFESMWQLLELGSSTKPPATGTSDATTSRSTAKAETWKSYITSGKTEQKTNPLKNGSNQFTETTSGKACDSMCMKC